MAVSSSSSLITPDFRLNQAKRAADQAEAAARSLRQQAASAQRNADQAQEGARSVAVQADKASNNAGLARQQLVSVSSLTNLQGNFDTLHQQISEGLKTLDLPATPVAPVVNADGQTTGTLVNVTA